MRNPFPPEIRTLSFVPRWNIVAKAVGQNVAEHSFYVALYAFMTAKIINWPGSRAYLMLDALLHDNDESITSDITGTMKDAILDEEKAADLLFEKTHERMGGLIDAFYDLQDECQSGEVEEAQRIVKFADKFEGVLFLIMQKRLGNMCVGPALEGNLKTVEAAWRALPADKHVLDREWATTVLPSIDEHYQRGGRGIHPSITI